MIRLVNLDHIISRKLSELARARIWGLGRGWILHQLKNILDINGLSH